MTSDDLPSDAPRSEAHQRTRDGIVIAPMRTRHLRGVTSIERQTNHRPWSLSLFAGELKLPQTRFYVVALDGSTVVGFAGVMFTGAEAHITNVGVDPERRRAHIATRMLLIVLGECHRRGIDAVTLEVRMGNRAAQELYRQFGFAPGGVRPNYYRDIGEDALIMWAHDVDLEPYRARLDDLEDGLATLLATTGFSVSALTGARADRIHRSP